MNSIQSMAAALAPAGELRAVLNLANTVLAFSHTRAEKPAGVTVDLSRELAARLGRPVRLVPCETPGEALSQLIDGRADVGYLAVDPQRAREVRFTQPYVQIEACYLVQDDCPLQDQAQVDRDGVEVLVIATSAYDLHLTRTLRHAKVVRMPEREIFKEFSRPRDGVTRVVAGIRQALLAEIAQRSGLRLLSSHFLAIQQAMVLPNACSPAAFGYVASFLAEMAAGGFIARSLAAHGIQGATVLQLPPSR